MASPDELPPPPEAILLRRARESRQPRKLSMRAAAIAAGVSETTWRHAEAGSEPRGTMRFAYRVTDSTLARMAGAAGISPAELASSGRPEAAELLRKMEEDREDQPAQPERLSDVIPQCSFERRILATTKASDEAKLEMIRGHRAEGHFEWCKDRAATGLGATGLAAASL